MEERHRKVLRDNRVLIRDNVGNPDEVNDLLYANGVFTEDMKQQVAVRKTEFFSSKLLNTCSADL